MTIAKICPECKNATLTCGHRTEETIGEIVAVECNCPCGFSLTLPVEAYCCFCGKSVKFNWQKYMFRCAACEKDLHWEEVC